MKAKISAWMDGELDEHELADPLKAFARDSEALECWRTYHLIGDAMRDCCVLSAEFGSRMAARLGSEATVLAPASSTPWTGRGRWLTLSAAASVAAVALVGWLAFAPRQAGPPAAGPVALAPQKAAPTRTAVVRVKPRPPARIPLPSATNDYLLAHQAYSPRITLQGMAPYVRTVSDEAVGSASR
jgi:sigma-E factor negative regulatory protein RseA